MAIAFIAASQGNTSSNGTTTLSLNKPAGTLDGHLMVMALGAQTATTAADVTITPPTGWTLIDQLQDDGGTTRVKLALYWKIANGEGSSYASTASTTATLGRFVGGISSYSGVHQTTPIVGTEHGIAIGTGTASTARVTPSIVTGASRWLVAAFVDPLGPYTMTDTTERVDVSVSNIGLGMGDTNGAVAAGTYTRSATSGTSTSVSVSAIVALQAGPVPPVANGTVATGYALLDFRSSTAGEGGALSYSISPTTGVINGAASGTFWVTPGTYTGTITEAGSGSTATKILVAPASTNVSGKTRIRQFTGTGTVS